MNLEKTTVGLRQGIRSSEFLAGLADPEAQSVPPGLTTSQGIADRRRFDVYRNNVTSSLIGAVASRFPVVRRLVGDAFFNGIAGEFISLHKPQSPVLLEYGTAFPAFIEAFGPAKSLPYLSDVARLEIAVGRAYHAAEAAAVDLGMLARIEPDRLEGMVLVAHPAAHLVESASPIGTIWSNHQDDDVKPVESWQKETVLVTRPQAAVRLTVIPKQDRLFAKALVAGRTIMEAADIAAADPLFDFGQALVAFVNLGIAQSLVEKDQADAGASAAV